MYVTYEEDPCRLVDKESHMKLKRKGSLTVIIPNQKELKPGMEHDLRKLLKKIKRG